MGFSSTSPLPVRAATWKQSTGSPPGNRAVGGQLSSAGLQPCPPALKGKSGQETVGPRMCCHRERQKYGGTGAPKLIKSSQHLLGI